MGSPIPSACVYGQAFDICEECHAGLLVRTTQPRLGFSNFNNTGLAPMHKTRTQADVCCDIES